MIGGTALPKITRKGVLRGPGGLGSNPSREERVGILIKVYPAN